MSVPTNAGRGADRGADAGCGRRSAPSDSVVPSGRADRAIGTTLATLLLTMETHTAGRRILPPVPRRAAGQGRVRVAREPLNSGTLARAAAHDAGQTFVAQLRAAAPAFATAAGARNAVVREAVPPARHRRSRCRVVLRDLDGAETDLTFVGEPRQPGTPDHRGFEAQICAWFRAGQPRDTAWIVPDPDALDGLAVDVAAWAADA
jgi:hypothetical protein